MDSIDKLLDELKTEYKEEKPKQQKPALSRNEPLISLSPKSDSLIDNLLADVKADFASIDAAEDLRRHQELEQEKIHQAQLKAREIEKLHKQAKEWLAKLDPLSTEGIWFEKFAEGYYSKLEAAIEYLQNNY
ncbi:hypothetical protein VB711_00725 [Cronbergia sp. UHCC 0137]|uniref:salt stress protein, Slr1339 family n=1 Tax=Cronbergia sp. UHCC 0137 TaxID=3110239 RepID=UPI002B1EAF15|nr:hypothetical protein [Cronbergia sp. UHCC 0137]MEA5616367.1 hypothetical protein [Cronbergia sp. UHCC 0137]